MIPAGNLGWLGWLLWPLSLVYGAGVWLKGQAFRLGWRKARRLPVPVISVGNLTAGGTGKTPLVLWLAQRLHAQGARAAILTRGYGRRDRGPLVMNGLGDVSRYTPALMGDEPILLARRAPEATLGIGPDRFLLARQIMALEAQSPPQAFLLDDGFQHRQLARDLDIVVLDATDPFGSGALLPAGFLREPVSALSRAGVIVVHRAPEPLPLELTAKIRRFNSHAPIVRTWTELETVLELKSDREASLFALKQQRVFAFCGIGNPEAFWRDLSRWGFDVACTRAFPDHYRYTKEDVVEIGRQAERSGAAVLLTTEKDKVNLTGTPIDGPPAFYCRIGLGFDDEEGLLTALRKTLQDGKRKDATAD